jgi:hypothetical protein
MTLLAQLRLYLDAAGLQRSSTHWAGAQLVLLWCCQHGAPVSAPGGSAPTVTRCGSIMVDPCCTWCDSEARGPSAMSDSCALSEAGPRSDISHVSCSHVTCVVLLIWILTHVQFQGKHSRAKCTSTDQVAAILRMLVCATKATCTTRQGV